MGVHGLWDLLAPVGRRVSVETLSGKKLAIDASIWMVQFMKAMRDEKGEMIRNAHLIGFFRRICKLLYLRTKPIFVFDGATPALKRRTVIARRRQRENAQAKVRKTAEKLLLNHLKAMRLKELAKDLEELRQNQKNAEKLDRGLGATSTAEEDGSLNKNASTSAAAAMTVDEDDDDEEMILPEMPEHVDPAVLAALPPSMQHNLLVQKNDAKGKKILLDNPDQAGMEGSYEGRNGVASSYNQEKLDEMLAASIAAEEDRSLANNASSSAAAVPYEEEDGDEDEEMILPVMHGNIDPAVLAALPPSMQLDLLVQIRETLMAENRQKYQKVKKAPEKFSELQIQSYLKTVAFRREIDQVQKAAAGRGLGGVQTSRIASEANREFIFSSSFTGDKQVLTSASVEKDGDKQPQVPSERRSSDSTSSVASVSKSKAKSGLVPDESRSVFDDDVVTNGDERGRFRVSKARTRGHFRFSKARAMGIRMTRDLQRNLDLMKEIEQETTNANKTANAKSMLNRSNVGTPKSSGENQFVETSHDVNGEFTNLNERKEQSVLKNGTSIEISFEDDGKDKCSDDDDDLFARLAAGDPVTISSADNTPSRKQSADSASDCDWEEVITEGKGIEFSNDVEAEIKSSIKEGDASDESEVEWEEHSCDVLKDSFSCPSESGKTVSRGYLEEEANLHEAIRRSLVDLMGEKSNYVSSDQEKSKSPVENASEGVGFFDGENNMERSNFLGENVTQQDESFCELVDGVEKLDNVGGVNISQTIDSSGRQLKSSTRHPDNKGILINGPCERYPTSDLEQSRQDASDRVAESVLPLEAKEVCFIEEQCCDASNLGGGSSTIANSCSGDCSDAVCGDILDAFLADDKQNDSEVGQSILFDEKNVTEPEPSIVVNVDKNDIEAGPSILVDDKKIHTDAEPSCPSIEIADPSIPMVESSTKESTKDIDIEQKFGSERTHDNHFNATEHNADKSATKDSENEQVEFTEASLEEEMLILDQECMNLEDEQRKLERNAESVSSEMFAECQELLQMFGLPYIIAPMEAEAQCAYLELANLVDGIVTDDSDVLLFGGRSVYKNIFDDRKYVETYFMKDIEKELGLTQEKLIRMALLLGSDYTEGVSGIGIVNAIEVVNAFPEEDGLHKFREWIESPDPTILGKFDVQIGSSARKRDGNRSKSNTEGVSATDQDSFHANEDKQSADYIQEIKQIFMDKHRNVSKNWHIPSSFPSEAVIFAYSSPQVDKSTESFTWGKPDLFVLHRLCWEKFGWDSQKSDELLLPVLKEYNKRETQLRLEAFYTFNEKFAKIRSKRINTAVKGITGNQSSKLTDDAVQEVSKSRKKRRISPGEAGDNPEKPSEESVNRNQSNSIEKSTPKRFRKSNLVEKSTPKQSRKRRISGGPVPEEGKQSTNEESQGNGRGRGRGRGGGGGRGRGRGRGSLGFELSEPSSSDGSSSDNEQEVYVEKSKGSVVLHRSTRSRKPVNYTVNDIEIDDMGKSVDQSNIICSDEEAIEQDSSLAEGICQDAAGGFNESEHKVGNPSLEEGFCSESSDYLERGGGFCMDESEIGQSGVNQNRESPFVVAGLSKDYLNMGGGFCLDESKTGEDQDAFDNSATATIGEAADSSHCSGFMEEADHNIGSVQPISGIKRALNGPEGVGMTDAFDTELNKDCQKPTSDGDCSNVRVSLQENCKDDTGMTSVGGLSAMPFLRRKRRKS